MLGRTSQRSTRADSDCRNATNTGQATPVNQASGQTNRPYRDSRMTANERADDGRSIDSTIDTTRNDTLFTALMSS